ncbi:hypothetical protein [Nisaea sp.]|uniref:hypothetical protein n=1 Tax=Nisaea sp. TaxID=2024842 RepID=UPI0032EF1EA3
MEKQPKTVPSDNRKSEADLRAERRASALRANLHRRKAQARQRTDGDDGSAADAKGAKKDSGR